MFVVIMVNLICDDFVVLFDEILGGENEGFEGCVVKGIVIVIENDMVVIDVGFKLGGCIVTGKQIGRAHV